MKSRTSFFNGAIFRKDITRFFPIWALYIIALMLTFLMIVSERNNSVYLVIRLGESVNAFMAVSMGYAFLVVGLLFGDLFKSRLCNAIHALPVRREALFFTHCASGILFSLVPNLVFSLIMALFLGVYASVALAWLAAVSAGYLIFFCIALFCLICTGNLPGYAVAFLGVNFLSFLVGGFYLCLYEPMLYGISHNLTPFMDFCPIGNLAVDPFVDFETQYIDSVYRITQITFPGWERLAIWGAVSLVLAVCALLLYRKRQLETAGDFICVKFLRPVFLLFYTLGVGLVLYLFGELFAPFGSDFFLGLPNLPFLLLGLALGFFTGLMLLNRTTRVFGKKSWLGLGALVLGLLLTLVLTRLDVLGITRYVPDADDIESVTIGHFSPTNNYPAENYLITSDPQDLKIITALHQHGLDTRDQTSSDLEFGFSRFTVTVRYTLRSGREVTRQFVLSQNTPQADTYTALLSRPEAVFYSVFTTRETLAEQFYRVEVWGEIVAQEDIPGLIDAILADCDAGNMAQDWNLHYNRNGESMLVFSISMETKANRYFHLDVWEDCTNTFRYMEDHGYLTEYHEKFG